MKGTKMRNIVLCASTALLLIPQAAASQTVSNAQRPSTVSVGTGLAGHTGGVVSSRFTALGAGVGVSPGAISIGAAVARPATVAIPSGPNMVGIGVGAHAAVRAAPPAPVAAAGIAGPSGATTVGGGATPGLRAAAVPLAAAAAPTAPFGTAAVGTGGGSWTEHDWTGDRRFQHRVCRSSNICSCRTLSCQHFCPSPARKAAASENSRRRNSQSQPDRHYDTQPGGKPPGTRVDQPDEQRARGT